MEEFCPSGRGAFFPPTRGEAAAVMRGLVLAALLLLSPERGNAQPYPFPSGIPPIGRTSGLEFASSPGTHGGAGRLRSALLLDGGDFGTDFLGMTAIVLEPGGSIGEHCNRSRDEVYLVLDGTARFTMDGGTEELPPGAMVLCPSGSPHGVCNHMDGPVRLLHIAAGDNTVREDRVDCRDDLTGRRPETPPPFPRVHLDRSRMLPAAGSHQGAGSILFRRLWNPGVFASRFYVFSHAVIPPGASIGYHQHNTREEVYYVIEGGGRYTVNDSTFAVQSGDALPCRLHDAHGIYNDSSADMEILIFSVSLEKGTVTDEFEFGDDLTGR